jgi:hypothetical protein
MNLHVLIKEKMSIILEGVEKAVKVRFQSILKDAQDL